MRSLRINQQPVFYKLYEGEEFLKDPYGNDTGSPIPKYGPLKSAMLCVSPNKGTSETEQFGSFEDYDRTMTTADVHCEIDENAVLWIDDADTDGPWNAIVKLRAPWKNSISYAIQHVNVSIANETLSSIRELAEQKASASSEAVADAEDRTESV